MENINSIDEMVVKEEFKITTYKYEPFVPQYNFLEELDFQSCVDIKEELQDLSNVDTTTGINEGEQIKVFKNEVCVEETQIQSTPSLETVIVPQSFTTERLFCLECTQFYLDFCHRCPMLLRLLDNIVEQGTLSRAKLTLPSKVLSINDLCGGVFALRNIRAGVTFGLYEGVKRENGKSFELLNGKLCSKTPKNSNWLQFVAYADNYSFANLVPFQCDGHVFFRSCKEIQPGDQLLAFCTVDTSVTLFKPVSIEKLQETFNCKICCFGFSTKSYLARHCVSHKQSLSKKCLKNRHDSTFSTTTPRSNDHFTDIIPRRRTKQTRGGVKCGMCDKVFYSENSHRLHRRYEHSPTNPGNKKC